MKFRTIAATAVTSTLVAAVAAFAPSAAAAPAWAPAATATIHPGVQTVTSGGQCTANFVFTDAVTADVYIGQAAHCSATGAATQTNGCQAHTLPVGTTVSVDGATQPGTMVYNSWATMRSINERNVDACRYNDFALVRLHPADHGKVNPSIPFWGGPTALAPRTSVGDRVYSYGNSGLRLGLSPLSPKFGTSLGTITSGWSHPVYTASPGIPGDSGSAFLDHDGNALGVLSTLTLLPTVGSNNVSDIGKAIQYMETHTDFDVTLVPGTEPFYGVG